MGGNVSRGSVAVSNALKIRGRFTDYTDTPTQPFTNYEGTMESKWMKTIPSWAICNWFYIFFVVNLIVAGLIILGTAYALVSTRGAKLFTPTNTFFALLQLVVAGTNTLFFFLICDRSLKPTL